MNPKAKLFVAGTLGVLVLAGCASVPTAPNVMALPGTGRTFDEFRVDDADCRNYAYHQIGGPARAQAANSAAVGNAAIGTAVGAVAGAAIGGRSGAGAGAGFFEPGGKERIPAGNGGAAEHGGDFGAFHGDAKDAPLML